MQTTVEIGNSGEEIALNYLKSLGYKIVATNWRHKKFEIDIIAIDKNELCFIEVKYRKNNAFGEPHEAVHENKQQQIINGASEFIKQNDYDLEARFDIISITKNGNENKLEHIKKAFTPEW